MSAQSLGLPHLSPARLILARVLRHRAAVASALVLVVLGLAAAAAPLVEAWLGVDSNEVDLLAIFAAPSTAHPLGTDELGRDELVRLLYGGRISLVAGLATALISAVIGTVIGLLAGYYDGLLDRLLMRLTDSVISLPLLPLLIVLAAVDLGKLGLPHDLATSPEVSLYRIVVIISLVGWTTVARLVRGAALSLRERDFVLAAKSQGASGPRIMLRHILPNAI
ncbi:MAG: ABC transporter permease, partial [Alphaproteobacteria bacterium]|nr:ABC transporter permease [Alphaproteobacteria bacterium]